MSSEVAQRPKEDISILSSVAKDLPPNTHLETSNPSGSETYNSACSPEKTETGSNLNSPVLSSLSPSNQSATNISDNKASANPAEESQVKPSGGVPNVPKRSSSNANIESTGAVPMSEKPTADTISISRKGSKRSLRPKSQSGSVASSQHSKRESAPSGPATNQLKLVEGDSSTSPKPKKKSGFLSFLNCCSPPENANTVELGDQAVPAKKTKILQQKPVRQPTPVVKANASAGESSTTGETKETTEEGVTGPDKQEMKATSKPSMLTRSSKEKITTEKVGPPAPLIEPLETQESPPPAAYRDPPLPPVPMSNPVPTPDTKDEQGIPSQAAGIEAPPQLIHPDESVAGQGTTINDRTPQQEQRDSDIAMVDAPSVPPAAEESSTTTRELQQAQINLPPPPPRNGNGGPSTSNAVIPSEKQQWLLPPLQPHLKGRKCLVLDLDETLVHSSFKILHQADFTIPVEIEGQFHNVYVIKRPGVDQFMKRVGELYEVVVFTASVSKDLSQVGRDLRETIIIDNSPTSYIFHPQHAVPISSWFSDAHDNELLDLIPVLEDLAGNQVRDVSLVLDVGL
ncbi:hypothetical protein ACLMJK_008284 [Lecanora helva]